MTPTDATLAHAPDQAPDQAPQAAAAPPAAPPTAPHTAPLRALAEMPGPRGWPLVGQLFRVHPATLHRSIEHWCHEHGPLFRFSVVGRPLVVLCDPARIVDLLRDRPDGWRRSSRMHEIGREMGLLPGLFGSEGESWRAQRRIVMAGLDPGRVRAYGPTLGRVTERLRQRWLGAARSGATLALEPELMRFTVDTIAGLALGSDINTLGDERAEIQQHLDRVLPALYRRSMALLPTWRWFKSPADRALEHSVAAIHRAVAGFVADAQARLAADPARRARPPNLLEAMVVAAESGRQGLGEAQVAANVLTLLLAGEETTAHTLAWLLHLLHREPAQLARACAEVRARVGAPRPLTLDDVDELPFIEACLDEAMRLKPVAPFMVVEALRPQALGGYAVPAGTPVWCVLRHATMDAAQFPAPERFEPERWLPGGAGAASRRLAMPFGAGPRICPGRYLALTEMRLLLAMLLLNFDLIEVAPPGGGEAAERMRFTMVPVGLRMRLAPRPGWALPQ